MGSRHGWARASATVGVLVVLVMAGCSGGAATPETGGSGGSQGGGPGAPDGESVLNTKCTMCHTLDRVVGVEKTRADWESTIERMETNGLVITDEERSAVVDFLVSR